MTPDPPSNHQSGTSGEALSGFYRLTPEGRLERVEEVRPGPRDWTHGRQTWTVSQIAEAMSRGGVTVGISTVRTWCEQGLLHATKTSANGHWRVAGDDLRVFVNGAGAQIAA